MPQQELSFFSRRQFCQLLLLSSLNQVACNKRNGVLSTIPKTGGREMGMEWWWKIGTETDLSASRHATLTKTIADRLAAWDQMFSIWREDTEIQKWNLNVSTEWQSVSPDIALAAKTALDVATETKGVFNPTLADQLRADGFLTKRLTPHQGGLAPPPAERWQLIETKLDPPMLRKRHPALELDCNALVSGLALDSLATWLSGEDVHNFLIFLGGAMIARGKFTADHEWRVGVESPDGGSPLAEVRLNNMAISTSGIYHQSAGHGLTWRSHIRDGVSGKSVLENLVAVTVKHPSALIADTWDTTLLALGVELGLPIVDQKGWAAQWILRDSKTGNLSLLRSQEWEN